MKEEPKEQFVIKFDEVVLALQQVIEISINKEGIGATFNTLMSMTCAVIGAMIKAGMIKVSREVFMKGLFNNMDDFLNKMTQKSAVIKEFLEAFKNESDRKS